MKPEAYFSLPMPKGCLTVLKKLHIHTLQHMFGVFFKVFDVCSSLKIPCFSTNIVQNKIYNCSTIYYKGIRRDSKVDLYVHKSQYNYYNACGIAKNKCFLRLRIYRI